MTVIVYTCDTCNRDVSLPQNKQGLETIGRCIITQGCRGNLHQKSVKPDFIRGSFPPSVPNLKDWSQRKILYNHVQTIKSKQWRVVHNLGINPMVQVFVLNQQNVETEITPEKITIVSLNELLIDFTDIQSGTAQCISKSSANTNNQKITTPTEEVDQQLSTSSELTIATLSQNTNITLELTFKTTDADEAISYVVDDVATILSPWRDVSKVLIKNKIYTIRSFQVLNPLILNGTIRNGTPVTFSLLDLNPINSEDILILLASEPYHIADKVYNRYVNVTRINNTLPEMYYTDGNFFVPQSLTNTTFPEIKKL